MSPFTAPRPEKTYAYRWIHGRSPVIKKDESFDDCIVLDRHAFDPDAVFLEDIVDDKVLPYANLAVDGLTERADGRSGALELRPDDIAANDEASPDTTMPVVALDSDQLDVYGWEQSYWKKIRSYFSF